MQQLVVINFVKVQLGIGKFPLHHIDYNADFELSAAARATAVVLVARVQTSVGNVSAKR
jgi:hypothetical protein